MIVLKGGNVLTTSGWRTTDVGIEADHVVAIEDELNGSPEIDATGCLIGPGLIDIHTHLREPGQEWKEDIESGSRAAAAGGFTTIVAMPNTNPAIDTVERAASVEKRGTEIGLTRVLSAAALTKGRHGSEIVDLELLYESGVRIFSDDGDGTVDTDLTLQIMKRVADLPDAVMAQHAEVAAATEGGHLHEGAVSESLGIGGLPSMAEYEMVRRDLELVERTGVTYHCQHVSTFETVELVGAARKSGLNVTAEVTPHHLTLTDNDVATLDTNFKMYPPLRTADDRDALVEALSRDVISMVATDHAPHSLSEKAVPFDSAPRGVIGLETSASVTWGVLGDPTRFFEVMSSAPGALAGCGGARVEVGGVADLVVFDPSVSWTVDRFESKSSNSPFNGSEMKGRVMTTIHTGAIVYSGGVVGVD